MPYNPVTHRLAVIDPADTTKLYSVPPLDAVIKALSDSGIITIVVGDIEPVSSQTTTAWLDVANPSHTAQGVFKLWNSSASVYQTATPALFTALLAAVGSYNTQAVLSGSGVPANSLGANGDYYFRTDYPGGIYGPKLTGAWPLTPLPGSSGYVSVLTAQITPPGSPTTGDNYLVLATATGLWAGQEKTIATWNGTTWDFDILAVGTLTSATNTGKLYSTPASGSIEIGGGARFIVAAAAAPAVGEGIDGDYALGTDGTFWGPKASGAWPGAAFLVNFTGLKLMDFALAIPDAAEGANGDYGFGTDGSLWGPKAAGAWPSTAISTTTAPDNSIGAAQLIHGSGTYKAGLYRLALDGTPELAKTFLEPIISLTYSSPLAINWADGPVQKVLATANPSSVSNPTNIVAGEFFTLMWEQTGGVFDPDAWGSYFNLDGAPPDWSGQADGNINYMTFYARTTTELDLVAKVEDVEAVA